MLRRMMGLSTRIFPKFCTLQGSGGRETENKRKIIIAAASSLRAGRYIKFLSTSVIFRNFFNLLRNLSHFVSKNLKNIRKFSFFQKWWPIRRKWIEVKLFSVKFYNRLRHLKFWFRNIISELRIYAQMERGIKDSNHEREVRTKNKRLIRTQQV